MANYASGVNPALLKWARERAGHSLEDVARSLDKDAQTIQLWESGEAVPTYSQLEKLAYTLYKRPIAIFFFPEPPVESHPRQSFRTLPDFEIDSLLPDTRHAIRQAQAIQIVLSELADGINPSERKIFRDLPFEAALSAVPAAARVREYLGVSLEKQFAWRNTEQALDAWRETVQDSGIFVFKRAFKQDDISGFCLLDDEFPVIYLNNSTTKTRQIFSLFHELAHLLLHTSGVTKTNDNFIGRLEAGVGSGLRLCDLSPIRRARGVFGVEGLYWTCLPARRLEKGRGGTPRKPRTSSLNMKREKSTRHSETKRPPRGANHTRRGLAPVRRM